MQLSVYMLQRKRKGETERERESDERASERARERANEGARVYTHTHARTLARARRDQDKPNRSGAQVQGSWPVAAVTEACGAEMLKQLISVDWSSLKA